MSKKERANIMKTNIEKLIEDMGITLTDMENIPQEQPDEVIVYDKQSECEA